MRGSSVDEFEWPCDRRDAHHPHRVDHGGGDGVTQTYEPTVFDCPGVGAHPLTQIGGAYAPSKTSQD